MGNRGNEGTAGNNGPAFQFPHFLPFLYFLFLAVYLLTLSPGLLPADSGEYQVTGALLGVAHPPGFALYTLLSWLTTKLLFFLAPATALNVLSAGLAALTLALVARTVQHLTGSAWAALGAAVFLGLSTTFWAQAVTANIRMPTACATAWLVERVAAAERLGNKGTEGKPANKSQFLQFLSFPQFPLFFALGLGVAHHASLAFVAGVLGLYVLYQQTTKVSSLQSLIFNLTPFLFTALPFLSWLYFPLRAGSFGAPPGIATWNGFWEHVLARGFAGDMFYFANPQDLPDRLRILGNLLTFQWAWPGLLFLALGGLVALWRYRPLGGVLVFAMLLHTFVAITYRAPQTVEYLIPAYVLAAVLIGLGVHQIFAWANRPLASAPLPIRSLSPLLPLSLAALLTFPQFLATFPSYIALSKDTSTRDYAETLLTTAPQNSLILANWHWATPLWYLQKVEGLRPDVVFRYVYPRTASLAQDWVSDIATALPTRPVMVTSFYPQEFNASSYRFIPFGPAWQVLDTPLLKVPEALDGAEQFGDWAFLGYALQSSMWEIQGISLVSNLQMPISLLMAWRTATPHDINFFIQLLNAEGGLVSQFDVAHPAGRYAANEVLVDRYTLYFPPNLPVGDYALVVGAYLPDGTRVAEKRLRVISTRFSDEGRTAYLPPQAYAFGSEMGLTASTWPATAHPGETLPIALDFLALRPLVKDYTVSISIIGPNWQWKAQSDSTPANGAIPTLKWITGSRVTDRHRLTIPPNALPGTAQVFVTVYDAFTLASLPIFDPAPIGTTLNLGTLEIVAP